MSFKTPMVLDGATGTNLMKAGMPRGCCTESWLLCERPDAIEKLHDAFITAGSESVLTPTFSANRVKLAAHGLESDATRINESLASLIKKNASGRALTAGDMAPTGMMPEPYGDASLDFLIDVYTEQAAALKEGGADYIDCETLMSLGEVRAAIIGAKSTGLPVMCTITLEESGRTLSGADPVSVLLSAEALGVSAFGLNCSMGPRDMAPKIAKLHKYSRVPLVAKPNAGRPNENGEYDLSPEEMGRAMDDILAAGAVIVGGCCGTTPEHIAAIKSAVEGFDFSRVNTEKICARYILADERGVYCLDELTAGDEIVPDSSLEDVLMEESFSDNNIALVRVDTPDAARAFCLVSHFLKKPVCFVSDDVSALEAALRHYNGVAAVKASGCKIASAQLVAVASRYGAALA